MSEITFSRRKFLILASSFVAATATSTFGSSLLATSRPRFTSRKIALYNIHTQEGFEGTYWREGSYDEKAMARLITLLRDRRNNKQHPIDPRLFDVLHRLQSTVGVQDPFHVICGYRSKETNLALHKKSHGVAKKSLHVEGKAIDLRLENLSLKELCHAARSLKAGGVGYYPKSNFIHVDIRAKPAYWT